MGHIRGARVIGPDLCISGIGMLEHHHLYLIPRADLILVLDLILILSQYR